MFINSRSFIVSDSSIQTEDWRIWNGGIAAWAPRTYLLTCKQFLAEVSDFLDESLGADERKKLEEHIKACPNCWVIADTTRKTIQVYECHEPISIPSEIRSRLMKALEKRMAARRGSTL